MEDEVQRYRQLIQELTDDIKRLEATIPSHLLNMVKDPNLVPSLPSEMAYPSKRLEKTLHTGVKAINGNIAEIHAVFRKVSDGLDCRIEWKDWTGYIPPHLIKTGGYQREMSVGIIVRIANDDSLVGKTLSAVLEGSGRTTFFAGRKGYGVKSCHFSERIEVTVYTKELVRLVTLRQRLKHTKLMLSGSQEALRKGEVRQWDLGDYIGFFSILVFVVFLGVYAIFFCCLGILLPFDPLLAKWLWSKILIKG